MTSCSRWPRLRRKILEESKIPVSVEGDPATTQLQLSIEWARKQAEEHSRRLLKVRGQSETVQEWDAEILRYESEIAPRGLGKVKILKIRCVPQSLEGNGNGWRTSYRTVQRAARGVSSIVVALCYLSGLTLHSRGTRQKRHAPQCERWAARARFEC